jgi:hypothetical protein
MEPATLGQTQSRFRDAYLRAFKTYISNPSEAALHAAYELGRDAVAGELSMLSLADIHHGALAAVVRSGDGDTDTVLRTAGEFLLQALSAYEMVQRGFWEAQEELRLEREHADQLRRLADSSIAVGSSRSIEEMLQALTNHAREVVGVDCCVAGIVPEGGGAAKVAISRAPAFDGCDRLTTEPHLTQVQAFASLLDGPTTMQNVPGSRNSLPLNYTGVDPANLLIAPIRSRGQDYVGFIVLAGKTASRFTDKDRSISIQLAQTVAASIDNALLHERERRIAETLQRGLLPRGIPRLKDVVVSARYLPGAAGLNVGGDWYDVLSLPSNRTGAAMGDVVGRGAKAATVMGQMRTAFRAYSHDGSSPESVVRRLDSLMSTLDPDHFSTMTYLVWDPKERSADIIVAGHPPPLLMDPASGVRFLDQNPSVPLGTVSNFPYQSVRMPISSGSILILYTDGLVEPQGGLGEGLERLREVASYRIDDPHELCDRILETMLPPDAADDVAVVVLKFLEDAPSP